MKTTIIVLVCVKSSAKYTRLTLAIQYPSTDAQYKFICVGSIRPPVPLHYFVADTL